MKIHTILLGGVGCLAITASVALAAQKPDDFINAGLQGDNTEIAMGQLAQQKGSTQQIRSFGETLVSDHTLAKQEKMDVAKQLNITPSDAVKPQASALQSKLSGLSGMDFDRAFAAAMIDDHQKDIADFQREASANDGPASALAAKQLPVLQKHLRMAEDIRKSETSAAAGKPASAAEGFLAQEEEGVWRGSKFTGVNIYGPDNRKVGDINDMLVDQNGKITHIVVGVGGFLGIGEKNVAIPFDKVNFSQSPMPPQTAGADQTNAAAAPGGTSTAPNGTAPNGAAANGTASADNGMAPATGAGLGAPGTPMAANTTGSIAGSNPNGGGLVTPVARQPRSMAYPDHGTVDYTADQLKAAPTFNYAK